MKESTIVLVRRFRRALFFATALATCAMHRPALAGIVYLNRCVAGCTVSAGPDDAANHVSSILTSNSTAPEFAYSDATFDQVAACVHHVLLPFDIHVVITDPGLAPRREIMLTTTSQTLGFPPGLAENSPYTGNSMENTIAFVFATTLAGNVDKICESAAHDIGILYGLEYVTNWPDIMATNVSSPRIREAMTRANSPK